MDKAPLERLDSFPYRHRVAEVMRSPVSIADPGMTLEAASRRMVEEKVSSLVTLDEAGRPTGILTERDILRALAQDGAGAAADRIEAFLSSPVQDIREDAFVYKALGRMMARKVRHLVAVEPATRRAVGMVTGRTLLKLRVDDTLQLGDRLDAAQNAAHMAAARAELPGLVRRMLAEGVGAMNAAAVISQVYCDMTRRATELAVAAMADEGKGDPPAPWAMLVLGSGGRGESLLAPDQDNAIVHEGTEADDPWFKEVAERATALLDAAGIPYCKGKVMASNEIWRRSLAGWEEEVLRWLRIPEPEALLMIGIFFDFVPVHGDFALAERLRGFAVDHAAGAQLFLNLMAAQIEHHHAPLGLFGGFKLKEGRVDLKLGGLFPITCGARAMALKLANPATSTAGRLTAVHDSGALVQEDLDNLCEAYQTVTRVILEQQIADIEAGLEPGPRVDPKRLPRSLQAKLKQALRTLEGLPLMTRDVVSSGRRG
jgi:signal-transduction protein with cAMP-binding, CBS, and nucleotidyltransferase domain